MFESSPHAEARVTDGVVAVEHCDDAVEVSEWLDTDVALGVSVHGNVICYKVTKHVYDRSF